VTDELGMKIVDSSVSSPDFHATVYAALGINPDKALYDGDRPVPITDGGIPIGALFA
jgi:arylsulfatase A-like enzyme